MHLIIFIIQKTILLNITFGLCSSFSKKLLNILIYFYLKLNYIQTMFSYKFRKLKKLKKYKTLKINHAFSLT